MNEVTFSSKNVEANGSEEHERPCLSLKQDSFFHAADDDDYTEVEKPKISEESVNKFETGTKHDRNHTLTTFFEQLKSYSKGESNMHGNRWATVVEPTHESQATSLESTIIYEDADRDAPENVDLSVSSDACQPRILDPFPEPDDDKADIQRWDAELARLEGDQTVSELTQESFKNETFRRFIRKDGKVVMEQSPDAKKYMRGRLAKRTE